MTKHLTKPIRAINFLVLAFLMMISSQVSAEDFKDGDVFVCEIKNGSHAMGGVFDWIIVPYDSDDKFKFTITDNKLKFGETTGWFSNAILRLGGSLKFAESINAYNFQIIFVLTNKGVFTASLANEFQAGFITGVCEKF